jgi:predicted DNA-binding protein (MmcQ/YjbR family)
MILDLAANTAALKTVLDAKTGAVGEPYFAARGSTPLILMYKVMGKTFAILSARDEEFVILKSDPHLAEILRETYRGVGHRSHLDRRFWISVELNADVPKDELERLVAASYDVVCKGLTRKQKAELTSLGAP